MSAKSSAGQSSVNASVAGATTSGSNSAPADKPKTTSGEFINGFHVPKWYLCSIKKSIQFLFYLYLIFCS